MQGAHERERKLLEGEVVFYEPHDTDASGGTFIVGFADDSAAYHKPHSTLNTVNVPHFGHTMETPPIHECAAWHFAKALGKRYERLMAPTVYREIGDQWGSLAADIPGVRPARPYAWDEVHQVNDAGFFDVLIGNQDRNPRNFLWIVEEGRLGLIDHGFAFPGNGPRDVIRSAVLQMQRRYKKLALDEREVKLVQKILGSDDLLGIEPLLEPARADRMRERVAKLLDEPRTIPHKDVT